MTGRSNTVNFYTYLVDLDLQRRAPSAYACSYLRLSARTQLQVQQHALPKPDSSRSFSAPTRPPRKETVRLDDEASKNQEQLSSTLPRPYSIQADAKTPRKQQQPFPSPLPGGRRISPRRRKHQPSPRDATHRKRQTLQALLNSGGRRHHPASRISLPSKSY